MNEFLLEKYTLNNTKKKKPKTLHFILQEINF